MRATLFTLLLIAPALFAPADARAEDGDAAARAAPAAKPDAGHWHVYNALQARNNSLGIGNLNRVGYRIPLYGGSDHMLLKGSHVEIGAVSQLSPASLHHGLYVQYQPVAPLQFRFSAIRLAYFGLFGTVIEYDGPKADWSIEKMKSRQPEASPGTGTVFSAEARLQLKFGPIVAMHEQIAMNVSMHSLSTDTYWYESINDLLIGRDDLIWTMKSTLGAVVYGDVSREFLIAGLHHERYQTRETDITRQIVGGVALYRPNTGWWGNPSFAMLAGAMIEDVHRDGSFYIGGQYVTTFE